MNSGTAFSEHARAARREYTQEAARYDQRWHRYTTASLRPAVPLLRVRASERLLDVGCGTGELLARVLEHEPRCRAVGVDLSEAMLRRAAARLGGRADLVQAEAAQLPFAAAAFDAVVSTSALHHWPHPMRALREIARVTRPGGRLLLIDWNPRHPTTLLRDFWLRLTDPSHRGAWRPGTLRDALADVGYRTTHVHTYGDGWRWQWVAVVGEREA